MAMISPSMLSADFGNIQRDTEMLNESQCDWLHLDVMDGVFVPNLTFGFPMMEAVARYARKPLDVHLMIVNPEKFIERLSDVGAYVVSVHYEACPHLHRVLQAIRAKGMKAGVVLNPATPVSVLEDIIHDCDVVMLMSVNPGYGGQAFIPHTLEKIKRLVALRERTGSRCLIEVDGGVNRSTGKKLMEAGADVLVAGTAVFGAADPMEEIAILKSLKG